MSAHLSAGRVARGALRLAGRQAEGVRVWRSARALFCAVCGTRRYNKRWHVRNRLRRGGGWCACTRCHSPPCLFGPARLPAPSADATR